MKTFALIFLTIFVLPSSMMAQTCHLKLLNSEGKSLKFYVKKTDNSIIYTSDDNGNLSIDDISQTQDVPIKIVFQNYKMYFVYDGDLYLEQGNELSGKFINFKQTTLKELCKTNNNTYNISYYIRRKENKLNPIDTSPKH
jgi:hypothetical protein